MCACVVVFRYSRGPTWRQSQRQQDDDACCCCSKYTNVSKAPLRFDGSLNITPRLSSRAHSIASIHPRTNTKAQAPGQVETSCQQACFHLSLARQHTTLRGSPNNSNADGGAASGRAHWGRPVPPATAAGASRPCQWCERCVQSSNAPMQNQNAAHHPSNDLNARPPNDGPLPTPQTHRSHRSPPPPPVRGLPPVAGPAPTAAVP